MKKAVFREFKTFFMKNHISENDWPKICKTFREYIWDCSHYKVYEDAVFCLTQCREKGYKNFILSNNFPELGRLIKDLGLNEFFSGCLISSNIGYEKPRIEIFQYAIKAAQQPDICYMIGDNPVADIFGGKRAGMHTILVHNQSKVLKADHKCSSLLEAIVLL